MTRRIALTVVAFLAFFAVLYGARMFFGGHGGYRPQALPVMAAKAEKGPLARALRGVGTLIAVRQVTVAAEVDARIQQIRFEPGAAVKAGDLLVQLNDAPQQGDLSGYRAAARLAELELGRARQLLARSNVAQSQVDEAQSKLDGARGNVARTEAQIEQRMIRAPFAGVLGVRQVEPGSYVKAGQPIVTLTDLEQLYVNFSLPEQATAQIQVGQAVELAVDAYPGRAFTGSVTTIEPRIATDTRTVLVQATLMNPDGLLKPGMFADVRLVLPAEENVVTVPETAIVPSPYGDSVFVVREGKPPGAPADAPPGQLLDRVFVEVSRRVDGRAAVAKGIQPGDLVVTAGQVNLSPGMPVVPKPPASAAAAAGSP